MTKANECTCPSGDGSLRHPCPAHPALVEQAGGDERVVDGKPRATKCPDCGEGDLMPGDLCACGYETDPAAGYACSECDGSGEGCVGEVCRECDGSGWFVTPEQARAALAQPSPAQAEQHWPKLEKPVQVGAIRFHAGLSSRLVVEAAQRLYEFESTPEKEAERIERLQAFREQLDPLNLAPHAGAFNEAPAEALKPEPAEVERPDVVEVAFVLRNIGAMDAKDIDGDNVDLRFEDAEGRDTGCDVSIVEYAEKAADLLEQHDRIVGELRAEIAMLRSYESEWELLLNEHEQQRDAALAEVERLRQFERICEGLPQDAIDGGWTVQGIRGYAKRLEDQLKVALARVAELEHSQSFQRDIDYSVLSEYAYKHRLHFNNLCAVVRSALIALPAQAQHSVPEISGIGRDAEHPRAVVLYLRNEPSEEDMRAIQNFLRAISADVLTQAQHSMPKAWLDVQAERRRQITAEGWTPDHDDLYCAAELPRAAAAYILSGANDEAPAIWPFSAKWWKPRDARANYMRAGALILAEIERLDRAAAAGKEVGHE
ncbi:hypothetical protein L4532_16010 [Pseudomonas aeruginosa]|uniref:hypothetical protein n=1 Tax=Pseudomonas aeruginosa TaxID=287 RepID=UPI001F45803A|nr:hypothetical protein [Pseudomonas aeruginosa]MCG0444141.1 hypothetical protein [Pseudomonas aeruginosa]